MQRIVQWSSNSPGGPGGAAAMLQPCKVRFATAFLAALVAAPAVPGVAQAGKAATPKLYKVERTKEVRYCDIANDPDRDRHVLDVFRPVGKDDCPVVFFVHGGGSMIDSKDKVLGIYGYANIAVRLAPPRLVLLLSHHRLL